ncbi:MULTISPECIES: ParB/RepB/Spo0J family partition protein [unclassified Undibacterium]|uniref:ParB/RepB/Spo0J family partition protein n=1 Tax=unclassified Undibacterium TaxID=2630295 RepID=UPI002AC91BEF|nr:MULTISPECIES: ParB/RepB/Spo0J family partition protein [unclassified Undibacterium]MEB0137678.1 ParB/RepB/Spo0J family partition protein [Undibacterium sp. CCC2.1]MEB0172670.1 ParB/RepB/Spo0J family partition protein [Undibacterium sp. CCC1.1]MEB0177372.1 ParB/RepB/Spo0J family partition protein [Undibacterium sp. CCC3.4]MEB0215465.1 ParB/RepB/Spo0J family partition protein [Undibacterium sp. 5I2]WPX42252.1 ParB/RepB/Spo0J family partition protein [Undibacterium sp. CCC3.4]
MKRSGLSTKKAPATNTLDMLNNMDTSIESGIGALLDLDDIDPDPRQPRSSFRPVDGQIDGDVLLALQDLADDIAVNSLIQPIVVRKDTERYTIIAGERRWRAFRLNREQGVLNSEQIPAIIRQDLTASKLRLAQLAENLQRSDLSDIETAVYIQELLEDYPDLRKKDIGQLVHKKSSGSGSQYVSRILAMLDPKWADVVKTGIIPFASLLEQYRPLPDAQREELKNLAQSENRALTSGDIRAAKLRVNSSMPMVDISSEHPSSHAAIDPEFARQISQFIEESKPPREDYRPKLSSSDSVSGVKPSQIKDFGGDALIPAGIAALNSSMYERREARFTLQQLEKLLLRGGLTNKVHQVSVMLPVEELKTALTSIGGVVPEDDSHLVMKLLERINQLPHC